jgi:hypothetical protein
MMVWTLTDNFEWAFGRHPKFGLFKWDAGDPAQTRTPRGSLPVVLRELARLKRGVERAWEEKGVETDAGGNAPPGAFATRAGGAAAVAAAAALVDGAGRGRRPASAARGKRAAVAAPARRSARARA